MGLFDFFKRKAAEKKAQQIAKSVKIEIVCSYSNKKDVKVINEIYSTKKPDIIDFVSDDDYNRLLDLYRHNYLGAKVDIRGMLPPYPYDKYDWNVLLQIVWKFQFSSRDLQSYKKNGIKKAKIVCIDDCECCKDLKNKIISVSNLKELPIKECPLDCRVCSGAVYQAVFDFDD